VPRLTAAGADLSRVRILNTVPKRNGTGELALVLPAHTAHLRHAIEQDHADLLILDPLMSLFGPGVDTHKDDSVRRALRPLLAMLAETGCACLAVRHVTKQGGSSAAMRGMGSVAFKNVARFVLYLDHHPWDLDKLALSVAKANIGKPAPTLTFQLRDTANPDIQIVQWDPESLSVSADALLAASAHPEQREIIQVLAEYQRALTPAEIARALGREGDYSPLRHMLHRMLRAAVVISPQSGCYALPSTLAPQNTAGDDHALGDTDDTRDTGDTRNTGDTEPGDEIDRALHAAVSAVSSVSAGAMTPL
ncbi:MAG TPA: AAA family ATPase, partial [Ktedonobacterales bacterium]|nr:AAA family ATPase [Ktedonobacterales bacterium]